MSIARHSLLLGGPPRSRVGLLCILLALHGLLVWILSLPRGPSGGETNPRRTLSVSLMSEERAQREPVRMKSSVPARKRERARDRTTGPPLRLAPATTAPAQGLSRNDGAAIHPDTPLDLRIPKGVEKSAAQMAREALGKAQPRGGLSRSIQDAAKPDCRDTYSGLGLLAMPALLVDALREKGCKWD